VDARSAGRDPTYKGCGGRAAQAGAYLDLTTAQEAIPIRCGRFRGGRQLRRPGEGPYTNRRA